MIGTRTDTAIAIARPGSGDLISSSSSSSGCSCDELSRETSEDVHEGGACENCDGGCRFSEHIETRSSAGSRKCVSMSAIGCSVWRYWR